MRLEMRDQRRAMRATLFGLAQAVELEAQVAPLDQAECAPQRTRQQDHLGIDIGARKAQHLDTDLVELDKLAGYARALPNFTYALVVVDVNSTQPKKGYVTQHLEDGQLNAGEVDIYLCGPPPMVEAVAQNLRERNIHPASFHYEKFAASA